MRQVFPIPSDVIDPTEVYADVERPGPRWLLINMITTADGATAVDGRSGGLGGAADKRVFAAIRSVADVILVGAGTVRAENYGPPRSGAQLAIVTASLDLDPEARVFGGGYRPTVITTEDAEPQRRADIERVADVVVAGAGDRVDVRAAVEGLRGIVLCEGGPSLNGQLIAEGLVDELCLTIAPLLASGGSSRVAHGLVPDTPLDLQLAHVLEEDGYLFLRYVKASA